MKNREINLNIDITWKTKNTNKLIKRHADKLIKVIETALKKSFILDLEPGMLMDVTGEVDNWEDLYDYALKQLSPNKRRE